MCSRSVSTEPASSGPDLSAGPPSSRAAYIGRFTLRDLLFIALLAALCMLAKGALRIPLHVPGHSGVLWVALFVIGRGLVNKRGAGVLLGSIAGVLATFAGFGESGPLEWVKWVAAGVILELLMLVVPGDLRSWLKAGLVGAGLHLGKLAGLTLVGVILRVPFALLFLGLGLSAATHVVFGAAGGLLGALVLRELRKIPFLDAQARGK